MKNKLNIQLFLIVMCIFFSNCKNGEKKTIGEWKLSGLEGKQVYEVKRGGDYLYASAGVEGLYRKQIKGGDWQHLGLSNDTLIYGVVTSYLDKSTSTLYAGVYEPSKKVVTIYRSLGEQWDWHPFDEGFQLDDFDGTARTLELTANKKNPKLVYAGSQNGVFRLDYENSLWVFLEGSESYGGSGGYEALNFDPFSDAVWVGGNTSRDTPLIAISPNGISDWYVNEAIYEILASTDFIYDITFSTENANLVYACTSSGIIVSENNGESWRRLAFNEIGNEEESFCTSIELNPKDNNEIIVSGLYLYRSFDGGETWEIVGGENREVITDIYIDWDTDQGYASITKPTRGIYKINLK